MRNLLVVVLISCLFILCNKKQNTDTNFKYLDENKMETVLTDIVLAEGNDKVLKKYGYNSEVFLDSTYNFIYAKHKIRIGEMDSSLKYYSDHPAEFTKIMEKVIENLNHLEN
ncbi:MAG: DUF4296 domain-containing protein [Flavobacteriales bacterium]|nr:DUF4296 domain-containing protein [Flavobacteriales bacterium]